MTFRTQRYVLRDCLLELMREHNYSPTPNEVVVLARCLTDGIALAISQHAREREKEVKDRIEFDKQLLGAGKIQVTSSAKEGTIFIVVWPRPSPVTEEAAKDALTH